jgi:hypothetical protein
MVEQLRRCALEVCVCHPRDLDLLRRSWIAYLCVSTITEEVARREWKSEFTLNAAAVIAAAACIVAQ